MAGWCIINKVAVPALLLGLASCRTTQRTTAYREQATATEEVRELREEWMQWRASVEGQRRELSEKRMNLDIRRMTVEYSPPDSCGRQYASRVNVTSVHRRDSCGKERTERQITELQGNSRERDSTMAQRQWNQSEEEKTYRESTPNRPWYQMLLLPIVLVAGWTYWKRRQQK